MARRMPVSYTGPREDVSLKALGGYAPSALQTDILPRSSIGDSYSLFIVLKLNRIVNVSCQFDLLPSFIKAHLHT